MSLNVSSKLIFDFNNQNELEIKYRQSFRTSYSSTIDFLSIKQKTYLIEINDNQSINITSAV